MGFGYGMHDSEIVVGEADGDAVWERVHWMGGIPAVLFGTRAPEVVTKSFSAGLLEGSLAISVASNQLFQARWVGYSTCLIGVKARSVGASSMALR